MRKDRGREEREGFFLILKHSLVPKRSWKISHRGSGKSWIFCQ